MNTNQRIIYTKPDGGVAVVIPTPECKLSMEEIVAKTVPAEAAYEIVTTDEIPGDRFFRDAWVMGDCCVEHDLGRCKDIAHERRRAARAQEFRPHDELIAKQIPGADAQAAEVARQAIRDKYAGMQDAIDAASTPDDIKAALEVTP